jgi:enoyl-CoA hydratase/carnithine racemase
MSRVSYQLQDHIATITLNSGENRFNPDFLSAFLNTLDEIEHKTEAQTLIVTSAHEKIFSNGIDLEWLVPVIQQNDIAAAKAFFYQLNRSPLSTAMPLPAGPFCVAHLNSGLCDPTAGFSVFRRSISAFRSCPA